MLNLVPPHGSDSLKPLLLPKTERKAEAKRAGNLKRVPLSSREVSDLFMLGMGAYTPLDGFMGEADWRGCCEHMTLANGLFWPIPITLSCAQDLGDAIGIGEDVALVDGETGELLGILNVEEKYAIDREFERDVAIKLVSRFAQDEEARRRLEREAADRGRDLAPGQPAALRLRGAAVRPRRRGRLRLLWLGPVQRRPADGVAGHARGVLVRGQTPLAS